MNKKINYFPRAAFALLVMCGLVPGLLAQAGEETNRFPNPLPAEDFVQTHLTNRDFIDLADSHTGRILRGEFLEWLLTKKVSQLSHGGLHLKNAVITNAVDFRNLDVAAQIHFCGCHFQDRVDLAAARFGHDLTFEGCRFDGEFSASALRVGGSLELKPFQLSAAWETGPATVPPAAASLQHYLATNEMIQSWSPGQTNFIPDTNRLMQTWEIADVRNLIFANPTNLNLTLTNQWTNFFEATAWGGRLFLVQKNDDVPAAATASVKNLAVGPLTNQWTLVAETGALNLPSLRAQLASALGTDLKFISDQTLTTNATCAARSVRWHFDSPAGRPLVAEWSDGAAHFFQPTVFRQAARLDGAIITGKLDANRAEFQALQCHSLKVGDDLVMFEAHCGQEVNFIHAQIVHDFYVPGSSFKSRFNATGMSVGGSLIIDGSRFGDQANFDVATVGNDFKGQRVRFENPDALTEFRSLKVEGLMDFTRAQFAGPVNFILAHIKGNFQAQDATFEDARSFQELKRLTRDTFTFNTDFGSMVVDGFAIFENVRFARSVSFRNARFGNLYFDGVRWPDARGLMTYTNDPKTNDLLRLEGMEFETIRDVTSSHFLHTKAQLVESQTNLLEMFASRSPYSFDIYAQLENYFRREGTPALADEIFIKAKERERVEARGLPRLANWFLGWTVGYGRQPWRAFGWSLGVIGVWGFLCQGCMVRKNPPGKNRPPGLGFALFYSLGTFLPIIDLGTEKELESRHDQQWFNYLIALEKILGYILVPLWTMALTGLIK